MGRKHTLATLAAFTLAGFAAMWAAVPGINQWSPWAPLIAGSVFVGVTLASVWWEVLAQRGMRA